MWNKMCIIFDDMLYSISFLVLFIYNNFDSVQITLLYIIIFYFIFRTYYTSEIMIFKYLIQFQSSHANTKFELLCLYFARSNMQYFFWRSCCAICCLPLFYQYTKFLTNQWLVTINKEKIQTLVGRSHYLYLTLD